MMWRVSLSLLFLLQFFVGANAQSLSVRTGEHGSFTRVVVPIPEGSDWTVEQIGESVSFESPDTSESYDVSRFYALIDQRRIKSVETNIGILKFELNCRCDAVAFSVGNRFVAIDIRPIDDNWLPQIPSPHSTNRVSDEEIFPQIGPTIPLKAAKQSVPVEFLDLQNLNQPLATIDLLNISDAEVVLDVARADLTTRIGTAMSKNLLQRNGDISTLSQISRRRNIPDFDHSVQNSTSLSTGNQLIGYRRNIRLRSSDEVLRGQSVSDDTTNMAHKDCSTLLEAELALWVDEENFPRGISEARRNLFDELDRIDSPWVRELARRFIYRGYGREAINVLSLLNSNAKEDLLLRDMAFVLEDMRISGAHSFTGLENCKNDVSIWALAANGNFLAEGDFDPDPALLALSELPSEVRKLLAPRLARILLANGYYDSADMALGTAGRLGENPPDSAVLLSFEVARNEEKSDNISDGWEIYSKSNGITSPPALVVLLESESHLSGGIDADTSVLVESYLKEFEGTDVAGDLLRSHATSLTKAGKFDYAMSTINRLISSGNGEAVTKLLTEFYRELVKSADDINFLSFIFERNTSEVTHLPAQLRTSLANRLLELGFLDQARSIIQDEDDSVLSRDARLILAKIANRQRQPDMAISLLSQTSNLEEIDVRAKADFMLGKYDEAYDFYAQSGRSKEAAQSAWFAERYDRTELVDDPNFGIFSTLTESDETQRGQPDDSLSKATQDLERSVDFRKTISDFLATLTENIESK